MKGVASELKSDGKRFDARRRRRRTCWSGERAGQFSCELADGKRLYRCSGGKTGKGESDSSDEDEESPRPNRMLK